MSTACKIDESRAAILGWGKHRSPIAWLQRLLQNFLLLRRDENLLVRFSIYIVYVFFYTYILFGFHYTPVRYKKAILFSINIKKLRTSEMGNELPKVTY